MPATPAAMSIPAARSVPRNRSSRTAEVQQPSGNRTSAGWAGWPNGTPCRASVPLPAGRARTTVSDRLQTSGSRVCARSMRSARAAGRDSSEGLRVLRARRAAVRRDCRTSSAYPSARGLPARKPLPDQDHRGAGRAGRARCPRVSRLEPVTHARLGEEVPGPGGFGFQLAARLGQVDHLLALPAAVSPRAARPPPSPRPGTWRSRPAARRAPVSRAVPDRESSRLLFQPRYQPNIIVLDGSLTPGQENLTGRIRRPADGPD